MGTAPHKKCHQSTAPSMGQSVLSTTCNIARHSHQLGASNHTCKLSSYNAKWVYRLWAKVTEWPLFGERSSSTTTDSALHITSRSWHSPAAHTDGSCEHACISCLITAINPWRRALSLLSYPCTALRYGNQDPVWGVCVCDDAARRAP